MNPNPNPKKNAILSIVLDEDNNFDIRFTGLPLELPMIGSLRMAEDFLRERIEKRCNVASTNKTGLTEDGKFEKELTKKEAIDFYLEHWKHVEQRIKAINDADDRATFRVDPELPTKF